MLKAWLHGQLGRALRPASAGDEEATPAQRRALREAIAKSEDALTSSVLGRVSYLPADLQVETFAGARPVPLSGAPWPELEGFSPSWEFWPGYRVAPDQRGRSVKPDAVVRWGPLTLVIEVKHRGKQSSWQWVRQLKAVVKEDEVSPERTLMVAVGGGDDDYGEKAATVAACAELAGVRCYAISWVAFRNGLEGLGGGATDVPSGLRAMVQDACGALARCNYNERLGIETLPEALAVIGPLQGREERVKHWEPLR